MTIVVNYENIWKNSFLDGDNNSPVPKNGRKYIASMKELKKEENHLKRDITHNTVMGLLNRFIGDQRKLYQARNKDFEDIYYFEDIENKVTFKNIVKKKSSESIFLRNIKKGNYDRSSWSGIINDNHPLLSSTFSNRLFSVLYYSIDELTEFILSGKEFEKDNVDLASLIIKERCETHIDKLKPLERTEILNDVISFLSNKFNLSYVNNKDAIYPSKLYYSALYIMVEKIRGVENIDSSLSKQGNISGISKGSFTGKDFMGNFVSGKKIIYGNPYKVDYWKDPEKEGDKKKKINDLMTVESGKLEIYLDIDKIKARELKSLIENAAVGTFYLGKKGLAYISKIKI